MMQAVHACVRRQANTSTRTSGRAEAAHKRVRRPVCGRARPAPLHGRGGGVGRGSGKAGRGRGRWWQTGAHTDGCSHSATTASMGATTASIRSFCIIHPSLLAGRLLLAWAGALGHRRRRALNARAERALGRGDEPQGRVLRRHVGDDHQREHGLGGAFGQVPDRGERRRLAAALGRAAELELDQQAGERPGDGQRVRAKRGGLTGRYTFRTHIVEIMRAKVTTAHNARPDGAG